MPPATNSATVSAAAEARKSLMTILLALITIQLQALGSSASGAPANASAPLWHRPGCYKVGHTRTISIPGCVKFNLSTNACRGFCMSFSIPAAEDIGPATDGGQAEGRAEPVADGTAPQGNSLGANHLGGAPNGERLMKRREPAAERLASLVFGGAPAAATAVDVIQQPMQFQDLAAAASARLPTGSDGAMNAQGSREPPAGGGGGGGGEKRDVISVGQCCNMMETEDVTVNLRCGYNETRRLVFKSAKTCECFFCKHV